MPEYAVQATNLDGLDDFTRGYLECAEWCGLEDSERVKLEESYSARWTRKSLKDASAVCRDFQEANAADLAGIDPGQAGHDFWLTRNRHGVGFWDRGLGEVGDRLTKAAHVYGEEYVSYRRGYLYHG